MPTLASARMEVKHEKTLNTHRWCESSDVGVHISHPNSAGPSFHYCSTSLPDIYSPITFYRADPAWARASQHRHKHIDPTSEPENSQGRHKKPWIHSHTINRQRNIKALASFSSQNFEIRDQIRELLIDWVQRTKKINEIYLVDEDKCLEWQKDF